VATSVVTAAGLGHCVAADLPAYEAAVVALARDRGRLTALREAAGRTLSSRLFDTPRFVQGLEAAFANMVSRARGGGRPRGFDVAGTPQSA
jgi:predicted O-linked N-acetylglucosamine transferase (SPINDLY family)